MTINATIADVTDAIRVRSKPTREAYLARTERAADEGPKRAHLSCSGQAHAYAAMGHDKDALAKGRAPNIGIITASDNGAISEALAAFHAASMSKMRLQLIFHHAWLTSTHQMLMSAGRDITSHTHLLHLFRGFN